MQTIEKVITSATYHFDPQEYNIYDRNHASYSIGIADDKIFSKQNTYVDSEKLLAEIAGEKRTLIKDCSCKQEDILITYFANVFFEPYGRSKIALNRLE